jgi:hypothetical protein
MSEVLVFEPDLLFSSRLESAASKSHLDVKVVDSMDGFQRALNGSVPKLLLVNLDALGDGKSILTGLVPRSCRLVGYYSHVDSKLAADASASGFEVVVPRRALMDKVNEIFANIASS